MSALRIYLDNAATSWPKPESVYRAVDDYQRRLGAPAGRGVYAEASEVQQAVARCRVAIARLLNAENPRQIVFTLNGTDALNLAIHGLLRPGDHAITSIAEHNSVLRPLRTLEARRGIELSYLPCDELGLLRVDQLREFLRPNTRLVTLTHASNVTGAIQPLDKFAQFARDHGLLLLVDAAQSLGHLPIDVRALGIDLLAAPGHKGLLGPLGTGLLYIRPGLEEHLDSLRQGGTGSRSEDDFQPAELPDKYEAGNLNVPGILGLGAGVEWITSRGLSELRQHEQELAGRMFDGLREIPHVRLFGPADPSACIGVVSLEIAGFDPQEVAAMLDSAYGVQVRAGLHCAPRMHAALGSLPRGGTVRFSTGPFTTRAEVEAALAGVRAIASSG